MLVFLREYANAVKTTGFLSRRHLGVDHCESAFLRSDQSPVKPAERSARH